MENPRLHGNGPYTLAVIHGGPGAAGDMAPVARELSSRRGILEPLQTELTVEGQVRELHDLLQAHAGLPVTLLGHSWGAWLSFMFASLHPGMVKKLILVGSGPFEESYTASLRETRLNRLDAAERRIVESLVRTMNDPRAPGRLEAMKKLGELFTRADSFEMIMPDETRADIQPDIFMSVMDEAALLRKNGSLLAMGKMITCPVVAVHGTRDPHPYEGVAEPLTRVLSDFRLILLDRCGHYPWKERYARDEFYSIMDREAE